MLLFCISSSVEQKDISNPYVAISPHTFHFIAAFAMVFYTLHFVFNKTIFKIADRFVKAAKNIHLSLSFVLNSTSIETSC